MKNLKAVDVMTRPVVSARKNASARDIAMQLLSGLYSGLPVTDDEGRVVGIVTEFDLLKQIGEGEERESGGKGKLPSIVPLLVYHGAEPWKMAGIRLPRRLARAPVSSR